MQYPIQTEPAARLRIDKWLWAARFFKTRSQAAEAVGRGRVVLAGDAVKASKEIRVGDRIEMVIDQFKWDVEVLGICEIRGPASVAQTLYAETGASRERRAAELERRRTYREPAAALHGRPTKRTRRIIDKFSDEA
jgi:ribosome-associated heat shock protein Hsp15